MRLLEVSLRKLLYSVTISWANRYRQILSKNNVYSFPETLCEKIADITEDFSFAYLKELFLSSMMQWMADSGSRRMDAVMLDRVTALREQMNSADGKKRKKRDGKKARKAAASRL